MATTTHLTLNNGVELPAIGFGVFQTPPDETRTAVASALDAGYRHIDTAAAYGNERQVGEAIAQSGLDRSDVFVESKIWISDYGYEQTLHGFEKSAGKLGIEQIDLLILHQALPSEFDRTLEAYRALETLLSQGKVRAIGVSNFMVEHLTPLLDKASVFPRSTRSRCTLTSPSPRCRPSRRARHPHPGLVADRRHHVLPRRRAHQHPQGPGDRRDRRVRSKSPAQVMLRWHIQEGRSAIPKSTKPARIAENLDVFDFELSAEQLAAIDKLDTGRRGGPEPTAITMEAFGRDIPEV